MDTFNTGPTVVERLMTQHSTDRKYDSGRECMACTSENIDTTEEHKNDIIVNLTFQYWTNIGPVVFDTSY